jgi:predicted DNA-binding ribbon-helix-helix protein
MKSLVVKRSVVIASHKTSVSLEDAFWEGLKEIARARSVTLSDLVATIDSERRHGNLSSAIRLFVLDFYRNQLADVTEGRDDVEGQLRGRWKPLPIFVAAAAAKLGAPDRRDPPGPFYHQRSGRGHLHQGA